MTNNNFLTEKEMLIDLITSEREISTLYNTAVSECNNPLLRRILSQCFLDVQDTQLCIYNALNKRGWINTKLANKKDIEETIKSFKNIIE